MKTAIERIEDAVAKKRNTLDLSGTGITEIPSEISKLPNLVDLNLWNTKVKDLKPLAQLKSLDTLHLPKTVEDLSPLADLKHLRVLDIYHTEIHDFSVLDHLVKGKLVIHHDTKKVADLRKRAALVASQA